MQLTSRENSQSSFNRASELLRAGKTVEARNLLFELLRSEENNVLAVRMLDFINVTATLNKINGFKAALAECDKELIINPENADAHYRRGNCLLRLGRPEEALQSFNRAGNFRKNFWQAWLKAAYIQRWLNRSAEAISNLKAVLKQQPNNSEAKILSCVAELKVLYQDENELKKARRNYRKKLRNLAMEFYAGRLGGDVIGAVAEAQPFYLPYQGFCDRELQKTYGSLMCKIMEQTYPKAPLPSPPALGEHVKVGVVSSFFYWHSNWKIPMKGWLSRMDRGRFKLFAYYLGDYYDEETSVAVKICDRFVQSVEVSALRNEILRDAPHVLIYPGLSMDSGSWQLAAQRLAPVQCNSLGHPETSGMYTIDYFLSSDLMEPRCASRHYSEKLIRLPNLGIYYTPPATPAFSGGRHLAINFEQDKIIFWSGQLLSKYLPQFDFIFTEIARQVENCQFIFIARPHQEAAKEFEHRIRRSFSIHGLVYEKYCKILPRLAPEAFLNIIGQCDLILDSIGWSGNNTTMESLTHGLPIITLRGPLMRGRHTAAILERINVTSTIANTIDDYIAIAVDLAKNPDKRSEVSRRIAENKHRIYEDGACIAALEDFLEYAARFPGEHIGVRHG